MKNYVSKVLSKINSKTQRKQIEAELKAHIDDRIDYYVNAGHDLETATEKANEHMGDTAELVGEQLNSIMNNDIADFAAIVSFFVNFIAVTINVLLWLSSEVNPIERINFSFVLFSSVYVLLICAELYIAIKIKRNFLVFGALFLLCFFCIWGGNVPFIFCLSQIFTGKAAELGELLYYDLKINNDMVLYFGSIFIIFIAILAVCVFIHIFKFHKAKNGKNFYKAENIFKIIIIVLFVSVLSVTVYTYFVHKNDDSDFSQRADVCGFYLLESNERVNPETIKDYDDKSIFIDYELFGDMFINTECKKYEKQFEYLKLSNKDNEFWENYPIYYESISKTAEQYDDMNQDVLYIKENLYAQFYTNKKYVMVVPMILGENSDDCYPDFSDSEWVEVTDQVTAVSKERQFRYGGYYIGYHIDIFNSDIYKCKTP